MLEIVRVAAIAMLSNRHLTSRMFVFFPTLLGVEYLVKVFCINKNMYVDAWEVKKDWDEVTLRGEIRKLFSSVLKDERGEEIG